MYVTKDLAAALGTSVATLQGGNATHMVDALIPPPFNQLHRSLLADRHPAAPPPYSCRAGLSVCLSTSLPDGPPRMPFRLAVKTKDMHHGDMVHSVRLEPVDMEAALNERRLKVTLDTEGYVIGVGASPASLFGFDPASLVGGWGGWLGGWLVGCSAWAVGWSSWLEQSGGACVDGRRVAGG